MSYEQKDRSVDDSAPVECYEFVAPHKTWLVTSYHEQVTMAGKTFDPVPITRTALETGSVVDTLTTMDFNIPSDHEIARTFCYTISPRELDVVVYSAHEGDDFSTEYRVEYQGEMSGARASGKWATIRTASKLQTRLNGNVSSVYYQRTCNHVLYDERCKALRENFTETATVLKIQSQLITVNDPVYADNELVGGMMTNTRTGEQQGIISNGGQLVRIGFPFFDLVDGDVVELTLGCDHLRLGHCKNRFNNVPNYGGFDFVPDKNPFEQLNYEAVTSTTSRVRSEQEREIVWPSIPSARSI